MQQNPQISVLVPTLNEAENIDPLIGSRYVAGGQTQGWPWTRRAASKAATMFAWPIVNVSDPMSGFFAVRRQLLVLSGVAG
ncbi:MAG: glycosyltransferase family 2 protein [Desulfobacteraceae bacterium]|nr:glycosyltransferase family 2 protein [Desulfobacteraceae bacterium]